MTFRFPRVSKKTFISLLKVNFNSGWITFFFLLNLTFCSCEKIISVNIDDAVKRVVIEGIISDNPSLPVQVKLSKTKNFMDSNTIDPISGALVTIQENDALKYTLAEVSPGVYETTSLQGKSGNLYSLSVIYQQITYSAKSIMPKLVSLDSLSAEKLNFGSSTAITIQPLYQDPMGIGNSYRFIEYVNHRKVDQIFVQNDDFSDGRKITQPLFNQDSKIIAGDTVLVEMQCIDQNVYKYFYSLDQSSTGNAQSASPTNPVSNIIGGAIGYFSAYSESNKSIIIP